jgi:exopolysaccharide production protein ExoQ
MPPIIASIIFTIGILGLFYLDRHEDSRLSKATWIPAIWLFFCSSRAPSLWFGAQDSFDTAAAYAEGSPFDRNIFIILLLAALAVLLVRSGRVGPMLRNNVMILLFFLFCAASILWADFPFIAFKRFIKALGDVGMILIILTDLEPMAAMKRLLTRLGFLLFPLSVLFIKYYPAIGRRLTKSWTAEAIGVTTQKNELGLDCMMFGVVFLWMFWTVYRDREDPSRRRRLLAYGTIIGMIIWLLFVCNSMTSIVGLILAGGVMWLASRPSRRPALVHLLVILVLGLALTAVFFDPGGGMVGALGKDPTLTGRKDTWKLLVSWPTNPWVGQGFESFWLGDRLLKIRKQLDDFPINEAHNGYLEVYLNLGWAGICFIALLLVSAYRRIISGIRRDPEGASLLLGLFLCTLIFSLTEAAFRLNGISWIFFLMAIMAAPGVVSGGNGQETRPAQAQDFAADEKLAHATLVAGTYC